MRDAWAAAFSERARSHWTAERTGELVRDKSLAILPADAPALLRALGILDRDAAMPPAARRKFFQVNHMVAMLGPALRELAADRGTVRLVDAGCGRSYLTLLLAHVLERGHGRAVEILGIDRSEALVAESARRTELAGLSARVRHVAAPLADLDLAAAWREAFAAEEAPAIDAVVALHACDTATDDAILLGVGAGARLLAIAPCCQAELARAWARLADADQDTAALAERSPWAEEVDGVAGPRAWAARPALAPIHRSPHLRRETAALVTDTMRQLLLRAAGYQAWALEFVPSEHTRKNLLLRAVRRGERDAEARLEYERLREATGGAGIALAERLALRLGATSGQRRTNPSSASK